ncbi:MAG: GNAT family N-acetyltransferase [archaeon]|jgi:hypothetical protein
MEIETKNFSIRSLKIKDAQTLLQKLNLSHKDSIQKIIRATPPYSLDTAKKYIEFQIEKSKEEPENCIVVGIFHKNEDLVGLIELKHISYSKGSAELNYWNEEKYLEQIYQAINDFKNYCSKKLGIHNFN